MRSVQESREPPSGGFAYITTITTDDYLPGVLVLKASMERVKCAYPLHVLLGAEVSAAAEATLRAAGVHPIRCAPVALPEIVHTVNVGRFERWSRTFEKLRLFSLEGFAKLVYVDSDIMLLRNLDDLFARPHMAGTRAGQSYPGNAHWVKFNSGVMVVVPEPGLADAMVAHIAATAEEGELSDQDVMQSYYGWPQSPDQLLGEEYNVFVTHVDHYVRHRVVPPGEIRAIHFIGKRKPWIGSLTVKARGLARMLLDGKWRGARYTLACAVQAAWLARRHRVRGPTEAPAE